MRSTVFLTTAGQPGEWDVAVAAFLAARVA